MQRKELSQPVVSRADGGVSDTANREVLYALPHDLAERLMRLPPEKREPLIKKFSAWVSFAPSRAFMQSSNLRESELKMVNKMAGLISFAEMSKIQSLNKSFNFDWNDYRTIAPSNEKFGEVVRELDSLLRSTHHSRLSGRDKVELGELSFKLGAYYNHVKRNPGEAYQRLLRAAEYLMGEKLAWVTNHIAFTYQQWQAKAVVEGNLEEAQRYYLDIFHNTNATIQSSSKKQDIESVKITAFAYCVQALAKYENGELDEAVKTYRVAIDLYEQHQLLDDQYARAKNRYAQFLAAQNNFEAANKVFLELESYWTVGKDKCNPYASRFYLAYAEFLAKAYATAPELSLDKYKSAYEILCAVEGAESPFAKDILKKIAEMERVVHPAKETSSIYGNNALTVFHPKPDQTTSPDQQPSITKTGPQ